MTRLPHVPALDGLRGLAVAGVLLFHAGVPGATGGHLGVTVFFALSGFLITSLLLSEHELTGHVDLRAFWGRRAKRLVPALLLALALVAAVAAASDNPADSILADSVAALTWSSNWWFLHEGQSYADLFADPSPLQHTWSLAVEEQYYLVFPLLLLLLLRKGGRRAVGAGLVLLTVGSVVTGALLSTHGGASARMHYGTDTRVAEILVGALLALALQRGSGWRSVSRLTVPAVAAGGFLLLMAVTADDDSRFLQRGGWALVAVAACVVLAAAVQPGSRVAAALGVPPLVWLGQVSYGAYLYHWPLFLLLTEETTGVGGVPLLVLRLTSVLALSEISLRALELPVREFAFDPAFGVTSWAFGAAAGLVAVALATGAINLPTPPPPPTYAQAQVAPVQQNRQQGLPQQQAAPRQVQSQQLQQQAAPQQTVKRAPVRAKAVIPPAFAQDPRTIPVPPVPPARADQLRVVVVGDSLGDNLAKGLQSWARERGDVVVYDLAVPGCPLSRGGERRFYAGQVFPIYKTCNWWDEPTSERRRAFDAFDPQLVVAEDGVNELFDRRLPEWSSWRAPGDLQYDNWLVDEYTAAFRDQKVLLVNTPCADWGRYEAFDQVDNIELRVGAVNTDQQRLTGVTRADLMSRICPNGQYRDEVEGVPDGRPDGLHLSDLAAARLAKSWLGPLVLQTAKQPALLPTR